MLSRTCTVNVTDIVLCRSECIGYTYCMVSALAFSTVPRFPLPRFQSSPNIALLYAMRGAALNVSLILANVNNKYY